jgi:hypothetical protein
MDAIYAGVSSRQQEDFLSTTDVEDFTREKIGTKWQPTL